MNTVIFLRQPDKYAEGLRPGQGHCETGMHVNDDLNLRHDQRSTTCEL